MNKKVIAGLVPIMLCFFTMGFVDLVGIATNYIQKDLALSDFEVSLFPFMLYVWFLVFSVPTSMLMNRIGRKNTVLLSLALCALSLLLPVFGAKYGIMLASFSLLGISNAILQTSLNPLVSNVIEGKGLASSLTFGQFVKAIASFLAPLIATWGAAHKIADLGMGWRVLFPIYMIVALAALVLLGIAPIRKEQTKAQTSTIGQCLSLLKDTFILLCFVGILVHVGIDVGINITAPRILQERLGYTLEAAGFATSLYFLFRVIGSFVGSFLLTRVSGRRLLFYSLLLMAVAFVVLCFAHQKPLIYACIALLGLGNSNVFSIIFAYALEALPEKKNEVSGLLIMGIFGGGIFQLLMGAASATSAGQIGAIVVMLLGVAYLLYYTGRLKSLG